MLEPWNARNSCICLLPDLHKLKSILTQVRHPLLDTVSHSMQRYPCRPLSKASWYVADRHCSDMKVLAPHRLTSLTDLACKIFLLGRKAWEEMAGREKATVKDSDTSFTLASKVHPSSSFHPSSKAQLGQAGGEQNRWADSGSRKPSGNELEAFRRTTAPEEATRLPSAPPRPSAPRPAPAPAPARWRCGSSVRPGREMWPMGTCQPRRGAVWLSLLLPLLLPPPPAAHTGETGWDEMRCDGFGFSCFVGLLFFFFSTLHRFNFHISAL